MQYQEIVGKINEYLSHASAGLAKWLDKELPQKPNRWEKYVLNRLSDSQRSYIHQNGWTKLEELDLSALLRVADRNIKYLVISSDKGCLEKMFLIRNRWAHTSTEPINHSQIISDLETLKLFYDQIGIDRRLIDKLSQFIDELKTAPVAGPQKVVSVTKPAAGPQQRTPGASVSKPVPKPAVAAKIPQKVTPVAGPQKAASVTKPVAGLQQGTAVNQQPAPVTKPVLKPAVAVKTPQKVAPVKAVASPQKAAPVAVSQKAAPVTKPAAGSQQATSVNQQSAPVTKPVLKPAVAVKTPQKIMPVKAVTSPQKAAPVAVSQKAAPVTKPTAGSQQATPGVSVSKPVPKPTVAGPQKAVSVMKPAVAAKAPQKITPVKTVTSLQKAASATKPVAGPQQGTTVNQQPAPVTKPVLKPGVPAKAPQKVAPVKAVTSPQKATPVAVSQKAASVTKPAAGSQQATPGASVSKPVPKPTVAGPQKAVSVMKSAVAVKAPQKATPVKTVISPQKPGLHKPASAVLPVANHLEKPASTAVVKPAVTAKTPQKATAVVKLPPGLHKPGLALPVADPLGKPSPAAKPSAGLSSGTKPKTLGAKLSPGLHKPAPVTKPVEKTKPAPPVKPVAILIKPASGSPVVTPATVDLPFKPGASGPLDISMLVDNFVPEVVAEQPTVSFAVPKQQHTLGVRDLRKRFGKKEVVKGVTFSMHNGEVAGLLGPNGAGKTTIFYMIVGFYRPSAGIVVMDDTDITAKPMYRRARQGIAYLPQEASIFRKLTVEQNIWAILESRQGLSRAAKKERLENLIEEFGIGRIRSQFGFTLSGGERRRTEIARALATEPKFLLLDEPFAGIDPIAVYEIKQIIRNLAEKGIGILITDHNVRDTLEITTEAFIIANGTIVARGNKDSILADEMVREVYLGSDFKM